MRGRWLERAYQGHRLVEICAWPGNSPGDALILARRVSPNSLRAKCSQIQCTAWRVYETSAHAGLARKKGVRTFNRTPPLSFSSAYGQQGAVPPQQAAIASQHEAIALTTVSGDAAKAAVPDASSRRPASMRVFFMVLSVV